MFKILNIIFDSYFNFDVILPLSFLPLPLPLPHVDHTYDDKDEQLYPSEREEFFKYYYFPSSDPLPWNKYPQSSNINRHHTPPNVE